MWNGDNISNFARIPCSKLNLMYPDAIYSSLYAGINYIFQPLFSNFRWVTSSVYFLGNATILYYSVNDCSTGGICKR